MKEKQIGVKIALLITISVFLGKILGFVRDIIISSVYGAGALTDALFLAISIPTTILGMFTSSADGAIIPLYTKINKDNGRKEADLFFSKIIGAISGVGILVTILIACFPDAIIKIFAPGFVGNQLGYSRLYLRLFSSFGLLHILFTFFCAYNAIYKDVIPRLILSWSTNALVIIALFLFRDEKLIGVAIMYFIGNMLCAILPVFYSYRSGYRFCIQAPLVDENVKKFIRAFLPVILSALIVDLNYAADKFFASLCEEGSVTLLSYASRLTSIFDGMIVTGAGYIVLPKLSKLNAEQDKNGFSKTASLVIMALSSFMAFIATFIFIAKGEIVRILYYRGNFSYENVLDTARLLTYYIPEIIFIPLQAMMIKISQSFGKSNTALTNSAISISVNILLNAILVRRVGLIGIAFATSVGGAIAVTLYAFQFKKNIGWDRQELSIKRITALFAASALSIITCHIALQYVKNDFARIAVSGCVCTVIFGATGGFIYKGRLTQTRNGRI